MTGAESWGPSRSFEGVVDATEARHDHRQRRETREVWNRTGVVNSGVVLVVILLAYLHFNG